MTIEALQAQIAESGSIRGAARLRSALTGISWEVDHIVPLQNSMVCGLHCEQNIQVITQKENRNKSNIYWPDMP